MNKWLASLIFACLVSIVPNVARAQYKNTTFGFDVGGMFVTKPSLFDSNGNSLPANKLPMRLSEGLRLALETNFKLDEDHWWLNTRFSTAFMRYRGSESGDPTELAFDQAASDALGTLFGVEGAIGVRYVILTDRIRPYVQAGISYMRVFSFTGEADNNCNSIPDLCGGNSNSSVFLPHPNLFGVHIEPGLEVIIVRDVAIRGFVDMYRWLILNATDNHGLVFGLGVTFFT